MNRKEATRTALVLIMKRFKKKKLDREKEKYGLTKPKKKPEEKPDDEE